MKTFRYITPLVLLISILSSCNSKPEVRFINPQPNHKRNLKAFPEKYTGKYVNYSDSSVLTIDSKLIIQEWKVCSTVSKLKIQEEFDTILYHDVEIELAENWILNVDVEGDSATIRTHLKDTIFEISDYHLLRSFKGYLFLNYKIADNAWQVNTMKLENTDLNFNDLVSPDEINSIKEITHVIYEIDTATNRVERYDLNPKKKELKEILKKKKTKTEFRKL